MKRILRPILVFLGLLLVFAVLGIGPELLGDDAKDWVKGLTNDHFLPVVIGAVVLALLISVLWSEGDKIFSSSKAKPEVDEVKEDLFDDISKGLAESYHSRIDSKLAYRFPINIELSYSKEGTNTREHLINQGVRAYGASTIKEELIKIFDKQAGRLLIVGEPGAGKTTILLQLALKLLERNELQIPIVINIATWRDRFKNVEEWFEELLPQMGFSKNLVKVMTEKNRILPLFDGFDELVEKSREGCLAAIAYYGRRHSVRYVICSRIEEYAATADAPVYVQVMVKPLTLEQIKKGLTDYLSPETDGIIDAINKDPLLAEAIEVPFYLNTVQLLFASMKGVGEFGFVAKDVEGRRWEIVAAFAKEAVEGFEDYKSEDANRWLGFLADRMGRRAMVRFELVDMQYDWGRFGRRRMFFANLVYSLLAGLLLGLLLGLLVSLASGLSSSGLVFGFVYGLASGLLAGLTGGLLKGITVKGMRRWSLKNYISHVHKQLHDSMLSGLFYGLFFGLFYGLVVGLVVGLAMGLLVGLLAMMSKDYRAYLKIDYPYKRFYSSMWSLHFSILQHWHLCYLLRKKSLVPKRYPEFLEAATAQNILESDGGSWRFRHRILQEYFVGVWLEKYGADEALADGLEGEKE